MRIGALDTDSEALAKRVELQQRLSSFDLNEWIFSHLPPSPGQRWLDLGCGRGKQSVPLSNAGCAVTAVDASAESLAVVAEAAPGVRTIHCRLDELGDRLDGEIFDRTVGSYSLYYADDPEKLFRTIADHLDGALFFCGPSRDNNLELRRLIGADLSPTAPSVFMEDIAPAICRKLFASVETFTFENEVVFGSRDDLLAYWQSHNLYDPEAEIDFPDSFINRKRGVGIRCRTMR